MATAVLLARATWHSMFDIAYTRFQVALASSTGYDPRLGLVRHNSTNTSTSSSLASRMGKMASRTSVFADSEDGSEKISVNIGVSNWYYLVIVSSSGCVLYRKNIYNMSVQEIYDAWVATLASP